MLAVAGAGLLGKPDEFGKWFAPLKWIFGKGTVARGPARGPPARSVSVWVATAVKKQTPAVIESLGTGDDGGGRYYKV